MKFKIQISCLFLFLLITLNSVGQKISPQIETKWSDLKMQFKNRSKIVDELAKALSRSKVDKKRIDNLKNAATSLSNHINKLSSLDSISISLAEVINVKLIQAIQQTLLAVESLPALRGSRTFSDLQMKLEGSENEIAVAITDYNNICMKYKRKDLLFHRTNQNIPTELMFLWVCVYLLIVVTLNPSSSGFHCVLLAINLG